MRLTDEQFSRLIATRSRGCYSMNVIDALTKETGLSPRVILEQTHAEFEHRRRAERKRNKR